MARLNKALIRGGWVCWGSIDIDRRPQLSDKMLISYFAPIISGHYYYIKSEQWSKIDRAFQMYKEASFGLTFDDFVKRIYFS